MKKKTILLGISLMLLAGLSLSSCDSCGRTERFIDDAGYGSWDIDGDGEAGREINFKGKCNHVDDHIPWKECDKCGLHKVYW